MSVPFALQSCFKVIDGFCHPDWETIESWLDRNFSNDSEKTNEIWSACERMWARKNAELLGGSYDVYETKHFLMLSFLPDRASKRLGKVCERIYKEIHKHLKGIVAPADMGAEVMFQFHSEALYLDYISHFYPDGDHPATGGICIKKGCVHFVFPREPEDWVEPMIAHELTHVLLDHLHLPNWIEEALAMRMENLVGGGAGLSLDRESFFEHEAFWNPFTIQQFWSGSSWYFADEGFGLGYTLAQVLWRKIEVDLEATYEELAQFVNSASPEDAGAAAFQKIFNVTLGELAADFLGPGEWEPQLEEWNKFLKEEAARLESEQSISSD